MIRNGTGGAGAFWKVDWRTVDVDERLEVDAKR